MEHKLIDDTKDIYVAVDQSDIIDDSKNQLLQAILFYYDGEPESGIILREVHLQLSHDRIGDKENGKIEACLSIGERAYRENGGVPDKYNLIIASGESDSLRYTTLPSSQS